MIGAGAHGGGVAAEHRRLTLALAAASDEALARAVAVFDRMPDRREADSLLDAARPRLRRLRPPRPVSLARLLFLPLDGAIVDAAAWKRPDGSLPRSALRPLSRAVEAAIGAEAAAIAEAFAGASFADTAVVGTAGLRLWRAAAAVAGSLAPAPDWEETGLQHADFRHCVALAGAAWRHADPIWLALAAAQEGPPEPLVRDALAAAEGEEPMVFEAILATILLKAARPGSVAAAAAASRVVPPGMAERVLDRWLDGCRPDLSGADPLDAARLAEAFGEAIEDLETSAAGRRPERRQRVLALRRHADEACRATFAETAERGILAPIAQQAARIDDAAMMAMEKTARALKRLETAGRSLGAGTAYDAATRRIAQSIAELRTAPGANLADLARLTEIIAGPEAALRFLDAT